MEKQTQTTMELMCATLIHEGKPAQAALVAASLGLEPERIIELSRALDKIDELKKKADFQAKLDKIATESELKRAAADA